MKKSFMFKFCACILLAAVLCSTFAASYKAGAETLNCNSKSAILLDYNTGTVVFEQNARARQPIASMVKIMTLLVAFDEAEAGRLDYQAEITVSDNAAGMGGSQAFLDANTNYRVDDLLKSIVVASANDSCVAIAEHLYGSVESFVEKMNEKAKALSMNDTHFVNCTGLPAEGQYCCAADVAAMSRELFSHKKFFEYSQVWMFDFAHPGGRITQLTNTNKLIRAYEGCDGGKTGFTNEALSCLSATAKRGNTRLISIVIGAPDSKKRNAEVSKLLNHGFANYETKEIIKEGTIVGDVAVVCGKTGAVQGKAKSSFFNFTQKGKNAAAPEIEYSYAKVAAPVQADDVIGKAVVKIGGKEVGSVDIVAASTVEKLGYIDIVDDFISKW